MKAIAFTPSARRAWRKLPDGVKERIESSLRRYASTGQGDVTHLSKRKGARLRVGDYRVIFIEDHRLIEILAAGHRREIYR